MNLLKVESAPPTPEIGFVEGPHHQNVIFGIEGVYHAFVLLRAVMLVRIHFSNCVFWPWIPDAGKFDINNILVIFNCSR